MFVDFNEIFLDFIINKIYGFIFSIRRGGFNRPVGRGENVEGGGGGVLGAGLLLFHYVLFLEYYVVFLWYFYLLLEWLWVRILGLISKFWGSRSIKMSSTNALGLVKRSFKNDVLSNQQFF